VSHDLLETRQTPRAKVPDNLAGGRAPLAILQPPLQGVKHPPLCIIIGISHTKRCRPGWITESVYKYRSPRYFTGRGAGVHSRLSAFEHSGPGRNDCAFAMRTSHAGWRGQMLDRSAGRTRQAPRGRSYTRCRSPASRGERETTRPVQPARSIRQPMREDHEGDGVCVIQPGVCGEEQRSGGAGEGNQLRRAGSRGLRQSHISVFPVGSARYPRERQGRARGAGYAASSSSGAIGVRSGRKL
jgi:hypothetical protein